MSPRSWILRIEDILEAIAKIEQYTEGITFETFTTDDRTIDAVIRNLEIIGEAARHLPNEVADRYPQVPWNDMRGMRNILIHEYFGVSLPIIWHTATIISRLSCHCSTICSAKGIDLLATVSAALFHRAATLVAIAACP